MQNYAKLRKTMQNYAKTTQNYILPWWIRQEPRFLGRSVTKQNYAKILKTTQNYTKLHMTLVDQARAQIPW